MKTLNIILIILAIVVLIKLKEGFTSFSQLIPYDLKWKPFAKSPQQVKFKPKKTSELKTNCDEKRDTCFLH